MNCTRSYPHFNQGKSTRYRIAGHPVCGTLSCRPIFNSKGEWFETEPIMIESDLPKDVLTSAATNFVGYTMTEITKIEGPNDVLNYEMNLKKNKESYEVKFSPKVKFL